MLSKLYIYFLNRLRVIIKSIGKKEENLINLITYFKWKKLLINKKYINHDDAKLPKAIFITISFYFDEKKINHLSKICDEILNISKNYEINIISDKDEFLIRQTQILKKENIKIHKIENLTNPRFLPWYHIDIMKKNFNNEKYSHFMHLEDDIFVSKENIIYWVKFREYLKEFNLIPGFVLTEEDNKKNIFATSITLRQRFRYLPKIYLNDNSLLLNTNFPYQAMYLYDRELMKEYLYSEASNPDHGYGALNGNFISPKLMNFDILAKANIGLTYTNVPSGFLNRIMFPVYIKKKQFFSECLIKHLPNKYISDSKTSFSKINVNNVFK